MPTPDLADLSLALTRLRLAMERLEPEPGTEIITDLPGLLLQRNPAKVSDFPSRNANFTQMLAPGEVDLNAVIGQYADRGIGKFFFWLDPLPGSEDLVKALLAKGFQRFDGTTYPVLTRIPETISLPPTEFETRRLEPGENIPGCYGDEAARERFRATLGKPGFDHFAAFHEGRPVASARLFTHEGLSYLNDGGTLEEFRNRGAQSALIAARVRRAAELGSRLCIVQTLAFLETSLGNLRRGGFELVYERVAYRYSF
jgi:hypothetical protein